MFVILIGDGMHLECVIEEFAHYESGGWVRLCTGLHGPEQVALSNLSNLREGV